MSAASACIPGRMCWSLATVNAGDEWPSRSETTLLGTPASSSRVAWVCRRSCRLIRGSVVVARSR